MKLINVIKIILLFAFLFGCASKTPIDKVTKIAERIISETSMLTEKVKIEPLSGIQTIDFDLIYGDNLNSVCFAKNIIYSDSDTTVKIGVSSDVPLSIKINSEIKFVQNNSRVFLFEEIAYNLFSFQDTFIVNLKKGENRIVVTAFVESDGQLYLRQITKYEEEPTIRFGNDSKKSNWLFNKISKSNNENRAIALNKNEKEIESNWILAPSYYCDELLINKDNTYTRESYYEWHYAIGTTMLGLINLNNYSNNPKIHNYIKQYCDFTLSKLDTLKYQYDKLHALRTANYRMYRKSMLDDTGPAALPFAEIYFVEKDDNYLQIIKEMTDYISKKQVRLSDGTFCRPEPIEMTVWADDLFMSSQLLLRSYILYDNEEYLDDVILQIKNFHKYLWDDEAKLHKHAWFNSEQKQSAIFWSRANGWLAWTISTALNYIPENNKNYKTILDIYQKTMQGIVKYQNINGLWNQVLDRKDSFLETSGSAMFTLAIARGVINGWLKEDYKKYALKGWEGLETKISDDGIVKDICRGTGIGYDYEFYNNRARFNNDPRGLGAVLTAATEVVRLKALN